MGLKETYERHEALVWTAAVVLPVAVVAIGLVVDPYTFWDRFLWEDIWGPTVVDAEGWPGACWSRAEDTYYRSSFAAGGGVSCRGEDVLARDEYTPTSEVTYGLILAGILWGVWRGLLRTGRVRTDGLFVLALLPLIVFGPTIRALEDAGVFRKEGGVGAGLFSYVYISPWIYIQIGIYAIAALILGVVLRETRDRSTRTERLLVVGAAVSLIAAVHSFAVNGLTSELRVTAHAGWSWAGAALGLAAYAALEARRPDRIEAGVVLAVGLPILAPAAGLLALWTTDPWSTFDPGFHFPVAGYVLGFSAAITILVALVARGFRASWPVAAAYGLGVNLAIVFGHMVDGFATFLTLCSQPMDDTCTGASFLNLGLGGYGEKHPLSAALLGLFNGWGFPLAKLAMVLTVIYLLDKESREGTAADRQLVGLIQMAIFVLGFGPGVRDLLLVTFNLGAG